jgi:hypothetical protein
MCGRSNEVGRPAGRRSECRPGPRRRNAAKAAGDSHHASRPRLPCLPPQAEFGRGFHPRIKDAECCAGATRWPVKSETRLVARKPSGRTKDYRSRTNHFFSYQADHLDQHALTVPRAWMTAPSVITPRSANKAKKAQQVSGDRKCEPQEQVHGQMCLSRASPPWPAPGLDDAWLSESACHSPP